MPVPRREPTLTVRQAKGPMTSSHIVVVEDDKDTREEIGESLELDGYEISLAGDGATMRQIVQRKPADLLLLDVSLPGQNGMSLTKEIRRESDVAIIMVTGRNEEIDRVLGLELGADDYITKPFSDRELLARVRNVLRRTRGNQYPDRGREQRIRSQLFRFEGWCLDVDKYKLFGPDGAEHPVTTAEFRLLQSFVEAPNRVHSREYLLDHTHGTSWAGYDRSIDGLVSRLRKIFSSVDATQDYIVTVRGTGYVFTPVVTVVENEQ